LNIINLTSTARGSGFPATKSSRSKADIIQSRLESRSHKDNTKPLNPEPINSYKNMHFIFL